MKSLVLALFFLISSNVFSQDTYFQKSNPAAKKEAVNKYDKDLALSGEQQVLFQKKVKEFLIKSNKIEKEYLGKEKLDMLVMMQGEETEEMQNILTEAQMDFYKKTKPKLQPLETVKPTTSQKN